MKRLVLLCIVVPNLCFASIDVRMLYIKAVADFSTCGNALMPWGGKAWQPDEVEQAYVLKAKTNQTKMQAEIDEEFQQKFAELCTIANFNLCDQDDIEKALVEQSSGGM